MSATATAPRGRVSRRPVIEALPQISVVPSPAPVKGLLTTILMCLTLFCGALGLVFVMNTAMVDGAYETQRMQIALNDLADERASLDTQISQASTTAALTKSATELGLVPAEIVRHIDLGTGVVTGGIATGGQ